MDKKIKSVGIDLSLTGTGVVILEDGLLINKKLIKSKPSGDLPINELLRIKGIIEGIEISIMGHDIDIAVIENLAFGVKKTTALTQLAGLSYFTRDMLYKKSIPFVMVAPGSLKKFITGNGAAKKDEMLLATYKLYGITLLDDNICDGYGLARLGYSILQSNCEPMMTQNQQEVVTLISKQL